MIDKLSKNNKGHSGKARHKPKAEEQELIERLKPLDPKAFKALEIALGQSHSSGVKLFMAYRYGRPKETKDLYLNPEQPLFTIDFREGD